MTNTRLALELETDRPDRGHDWLVHFFERAARRAGQMRCGITGHQVLIRHTSSRLSLQCSLCGYESPGWELEQRLVFEAGQVREPAGAREERTLMSRPAAPIGPPVIA